MLKVGSSTNSASLLTALSHSYLRTSVPALIECMRYGHLGATPGGGGNGTRVGADLWLLNTLAQSVVMAPSEFAAHSAAPLAPGVRRSAPEPADSGFS